MTRSRILDNLAFPLIQLFFNRLLIRLREQQLCKDNITTFRQIFNRTIELSIPVVDIERNNKKYL